MLAAWPRRGDFGLADHGPRDPQQALVEELHPRLALLAYLRSHSTAGGAAALRDLEYPTGDTACALPHVLAEPLQPTREHADAVGQQRRVRRIVDVGLHDGRVDPQAPALDDPPGPAQHDQLRQQVLEDGLVEQVGQADQRLGIGDPLAVDPAEGAVDQAAAYFPFALIETPVVQVLEHQHSQDDSRRCTQATPALTLRVTLGQGLRHPINQALVRRAVRRSGEGWDPTAGRRRAGALRSDCVAGTLAAPWRLR